MTITINYATQWQPDWLKAHPIAAWIVLAVVALLGLWLISRTADSGDGEIQPKHRWFELHRSARLVHCLACGKKVLVAIREGETWSWQCPRCGERSVVSMDSTARITITTPNYGRVRYTQRTQLFGLLTKIYHSEVLEPAKSLAVRRHVNDEPPTVISQSIDGMFKREFRAAFVRGLLLDRWKRIAGFSAIISFLVPLGHAHNLHQLCLHIALGFSICVALCVGLLWWNGWRTFSRWMGSRDALYCWLQRSEGIALAVVMASPPPKQFHFEALRILGGRKAWKLGVELMHDVCQYADGNGTTLSINASEPEWLIELGFERAVKQLRRGSSTLVRRPQSSGAGEQGTLS
ncbi:hypothetical protein [Nocardia sp. NPDC004123]